MLLEIWKRCCNWWVYQRLYWLYKWYC